MNKKPRKSKTTPALTSSSQPAPTNPAPTCPPYPPLPPAGSPVTLESVLAAILNTSAKVGNALERINELEAKIFDLQEAAAANDTNMVDKVATIETNVHDIQETFKNKIELAFSNIKAEIESLKKVPKRKVSSESQEKSCTMCEETFVYNADLEKHMNNEHNASKDFECTVCGKRFLLEWRRKKHAQMHTVIPRTCRFFLTNMPCPFEEIGCKFSHTIQPSTCHVDTIRHGHEEQPQLSHAEQPYLYHAAPE